jgi:hypothetical protein
MIADLAAALAAVLLLATVACFGPGWFFVRRLKWQPLEQIGASIALSLLLLFLVSFGLYWLGGPAWASGAALAACGLATAASWRDTRRLWQSPLVRRTVWSWLGLVAWTFLLLAVIRQYGGGSSCCDWLEHYQRTVHFIRPWPSGFLYIDRFLFSARPPLMNAVTALLLRHVDDAFVHYQVVFAFVNLLLFFACAQISAVLSRDGRPADPVVLALLLGGNPMFMVNTTFPWTKALTVFLLFVGLALYVTGLRGGRARSRLVAAFLAFGAAIVAHYSAVLCVVPVAVHYLAVTRPVRARRAGEVLLTIAPGVLLVSVWVAHVLVEHGGLAGLLRNPSVDGTASLPWLETLGHRFLNLRDTFVPHIWLGYNGYPEDASTLRLVIDNIFTIYHFNAVVSMGCLGGLLVAWLAVSALRRRPLGQEAGLWLTLVAFVWTAGVLVHGDREPAGLAIVVLQPVTYLGITFLATRVRALPAWARTLCLAGWFVDVVAGIGLEVWFESGYGTWAKTPNWDMKEAAGVSFLADHVGSTVVPVVLLAAMAAWAGVLAVRHIALAQVPGGPDPV